MTSRRRALSALVLFLLTGCQSWGNGRPLDAVPMPVGERDRFEVWSRGESHELHAVRIDGDTLRGVPWWNEPTCDSCQVAIPRAAVDSVRVRTYDGGKTGIGLSLLVLLSIPVMLIIGMSGDNY